MNIQHSSLWATEDICPSLVVIFRGY